MPDENLNSGEIETNDTPEFSEADAEEAERTIKTAIKNYESTGDLSQITNEISYLYNKGFTKSQIGSILNVADHEIPDLAAMDFSEGAYGQNLNNTEFNPTTILGMPFKYDTITDPGNRVYNYTLLSDAPIVYMIPGKPKFAKHNPELKKYFGSDSTDNVTEAELLKDLAEDNEESLANWLKQKASKSKDLRYYGFQADYSNFLKHLQVNISTLGIKMGVTGGTFRFSDMYEKEWLDNGMQFYCTNNTSVSESLENSFSDSAIESAINSISAMSREFQFLTGSAKGDMSNISNEKLQSEIDDMNNSTGVIDKLTGALKAGVGFVKNAALSGSNLMFPKVWSDSSFSRSYNLEFQFSSPYGDPKSIFEYVYMPFMVLLTMAMPRMDSLMGYYSPYIIRTEIPGTFVCDMGVISSMSWKRGGSSKPLYTFNSNETKSLPLEMEVSISVQDLYPVLAMTQQYSVMKYNTGLHHFIDNMAGLEVDRIRFTESLFEKVLSGVNLAYSSFDIRREGLLQTIRNVTRSLNGR